MRKTILHRTIIAVVGVLIFAAVALGVLRNSFIKQRHSHDVHHAHGNHAMADEAHSAAKGRALFSRKGCSQCHAAESARTKIGPGLKGLFDRTKLPVSGRAVTEENVRQQLQNPYRNMPSFAGRLSEEEAGQIIAFLKTL